ncbi:amino acid adenylation domain-containing protein [Kitasatospora sp. NPDC087314]|uniref:amino acid adenylation domain-containing protein n=1 Tax=Kitasatospora sp. NPDC087314 TaxID=3364068 RepID=UPI00382EC438
MSEVQTSTSRQDRIAALPEHLRALLRDRLAGAEAPAPAAAASTALRPVDRGRPLPMSFAQQRMWFLYEFDPQAVGYNSSFALRLRGELDHAALHRALAAVVGRHEALRTTYDQVDGVPVQIPHPSVDIPLPVVEAGGGTAEDREDELLRLVREEAARPFDLRTGPVLRTLLVRLSEREHVLVLSIHHIAHDGWSLSIVTRELGQSYAAALQGREADLPAPGPQYADYSVWQRERLSDGRLDEQLDYWRKQLDGVPVLELPTDRQRPAVPTGAGAFHEFSVPAETVAGLRELTESAAATLFMTLTAATQLLLARLSRQEDVAVGTPVAGRDEPELADLVGLFLNTLVLRARTEPGLGFREFLGQVRDTVLAGFDHAEVPFERVVDAVQPERDPSRMPLAQVLIVLQNAPEAVLDLPGLTMEQLALPQASTGFDLVVAFEERPDGSLWSALEYSTDLYDEDTVRRFAGHLTTLLGSIAADPDQELGRLDLLNPKEHHRLTVDWARNPVAFPEQDPVHLLVAKRAAERPDQLAVVRGDEQLSYAELDRLSGLLAQVLRERGTRPGDVVGICCERGPAQVAATLAVLKAGAAFLPLNPRFPAARRELMLSETGARFVFTQRSLAADFAGSADSAASAAEPLVLEDLRPQLDAHTGAVPEGLPVAPDALAYIVYTSGSTGTPKGVLLGHGGLTNMINASRLIVGTGPDNTVCQLSSPSFDGAVWETFLALVSGAVLAIPANESEALGGEQLRTMAAGRPTVLGLPPAALAAVEPEALPAGSVVLAVGDRCPVGLARKWSRVHRFINGYGPTENTVGATMFEVRAEEGGTRLSIGRPLPNTEVYLLDPHGNPVPAAVTGEIHLGGRGVAQGYLGRPELTSQRFVPHPFDDDPKARLYRTGDLAAWLPDGRIDFRGRVDDQVKVRGFRVEPGEIEAAMQRHPAIEQAAVVVRESDRGKQLVGYLVAAPGHDQGETVRAVRAALTEELPAFMVPAALIPMERLPLTTNGKVDRDALPDARAALARVVTPPNGPVETALAAVFRSVLGVEDVGAEDDFFLLGGDSILSTQVVARARQEGLHFTARDLFQHKTVAALAKVAGTGDAGPAEEDPYRTGPVPLTAVQQWFFEHHTVNPDHFNQSLLFELVPGTDVEALRTALAALVAQHDMLRARYTRDGAGVWSQEVAEQADGCWDFRLLDLARAGDDVEERLTEAFRQAQRGLRLADGPLLRAVLADLGPDRPARLFLTAHHLVVDGVSWRVLLDDLRSAYADLTAGRPVRLAPRSTSFGQWSRRLREHALAGGFDDELAHWRALPAAVEQSAGEPVGTGRFGDRRTVRHTLTVDETEALLRRVPGALRAQVHEVLLTALAQALAAQGHAGDGGTVIDLEGHGREEILDGVDLSRTVGWFTTIYPVLLDVPADLAPPAAVRTAKRRLRAVPRRGIGHGVLRLAADAAAREDLRVPAPRARIGFNYLGQWDNQLPEGDRLILRHLDHGGGDHEPAETRTYELDVAAAVEGGRMELSCVHAGGRFDDAAVTALLQGMHEALRAIIRACG